jgi:hypothetical protein
VARDRKRGDAGGGLGLAREKRQPVGLGDNGSGPFSRKPGAIQEACSSASMVSPAFAKTARPFASVSPATWLDVQMGQKHLVSQFRSNAGGGEASAEATGVRG